MPSDWHYVLQGDVEAACIYILKNASELTNFSGGAPRVSSDLEGYSKGARWIMVSREGSVAVWPKIDRPRLDFNVYAENRRVAHDLAQIAQAALFRKMDSSYSQYGVRITDMRVETGIFRAPDVETGSPRYIFALRLTCVPYSS